MKKIIILLISLILSITLIGCKKDQLTNGDVLYKTNWGKLAPYLFLVYKIKKEFNLDEKIEIELSYATKVKEISQDSSTIDEEEIIKHYKAEISVINCENFKTYEEETDFIRDPYNNENRIIIKSFNDFCEENYGFKKNGKCKNSITYELPKSLFTNQSGIILFNLKTNGETMSPKIHYTITENKIIFTSR